MHIDKLSDKQPGLKLQSKTPFYLISLKPCNSEKQAILLEYLFLPQQIPAE